MASWITTHYPHQQPDTHPWHIYLQEEFEEVARSIKDGDRVLFYELGRHKPLLTGEKFPEGRQGIVASGIVRGTPLIRHPSQSLLAYADGTTANWKWELRTAGLDFEGYTPREEVFEVLNYRCGYTMRGFGTRGSGVKALSGDQYDGLFHRFKRRRAMPTPTA